MQVFLLVIGKPGLDLLAGIHSQLKSFNPYAGGG